MTTPIAETRQGWVRGLLEDGVAQFRGVPYAAPPVAALRFEPPQLPPSWSGVRDATQHGLLPAQMPSRLARVLGDYDLPHGEDCLSLNISTPTADSAGRPVLVWLHGGAFVTGGNAIEWYDGSAFARHHDIVFVGVNYRLGALGFLQAEGVSSANLGLRDQHAALQWVRDNIEAFGGDPEQVTLVGQSAGAISAFALLARKDSSALFNRAILQSGRLSALSDSATARAAGEAMVAASGLPADAFRRLPLDDLMKLQAAQMRAGASEFAKTTAPFWPCADGEFIPTDTVNAAVNNAVGKQFMIGWTRDEMAAFFAGSEQINAATQAQMEQALEREWGSNWCEGEQFARARVPGGNPERVLDAAINERMFAGSSVMFAEHLMSVQPAWLYRFDWAPPGSAFGACHCIELPFVFDNAERWRPPMLEGADTHAVRALSDIVQTGWASFVRNGDPNHERLPRWPRYEADRRWVLRIDDIIEAVGDIGGVSLEGRPRPRYLGG